MKWLISIANISRRSYGAQVLSGEALFWTLEKVMLCIGNLDPLTPIIAIGFLRIRECSHGAREGPNTHSVTCPNESQACSYVTRLHTRVCDWGTVNS